MIRFILPVLLLLVASCAAPQGSDSCTDCPTAAECAGCPTDSDCSDCDAPVDNATATQAVLLQAQDLCPGCTDAGMCSDCETGLKAMVDACPGCSASEFCDGCLENVQTAVSTASVEGCCSEEGAAATTATAVQASHEGCVMAGTGACEGGECPMKAACDAGVTACNDGAGCEMGAKTDNATATKALLIEATADCEGCKADAMCSDCDTAVKAMWAACEGCTEGAFCNECLTNIKSAMAGECEGSSCETGAETSTATTASNEEAGGCCKESGAAATCEETPQG